MPRSCNYMINQQVNLAGLSKVVDLIDGTSREWRTNLINVIFPGEIVQKIQRIPLPCECIGDM